MPCSLPQECLVDHISGNKQAQPVQKEKQGIHPLLLSRSYSLDGTGRILFPKRLLGYDGIAKEVVLFAYIDRIEVWDKSTYDNLLTDEPDDFSRLAEDVMGNQSESNDEEADIS